MSITEDILSKLKPLLWTRGVDVDEVLRFWEYSSCACSGEATNSVVEIEYRSADKRKKLSVYTYPYDLEALIDELDYREAKGL